MSVSFQHISVRLGGRQILDGVSLETVPGQITGIVGPNGSGKSTLIKTLFGIVPRQSGDIFLNGVPLSSLTRRQIAGQAGYVGQDAACVFDFSVREVVEMALYHQRGNSRQAVDRALSDLNISHLAQSSILTLSGGERKLVFLARAIAQGADTLILDEPTNHLDIRHQLLILDYLKGSGKTVLIVLHDLNMAAMYCDRLYAMKDGKLVGQGPPGELLTPEFIRRVYAVDAGIITDTDGVPHIVFRSGAGGTGNGA